MRKILLALPFLCGPALADTIVPRDVAWYMAHPGILSQTLQVCHGNAAFMATPDCANAEGAGAGLMGRQYRQAATSMNLYDPNYWSGNTIARDGILAQCRRRAPGDELAFPYCKAASASKLQELRR